MKPLMTVQEVLTLIPIGETLLRQCIHGQHETYPPLRAKRGPRGQILITDEALREWINALPDA